jgi:hypothetical protein
MNNYKILMAADIQLTREVFSYSREVFSYSREALYYAIWDIWRFLKEFSVFNWEIFSSRNLI